MNPILVRDAESQLNLEGRAIGNNPVGLNARGRLQVLTTAEAVASLGAGALYTSSLASFLGTATIISWRLVVEVRPRDKLMEVNIWLPDSLTQDAMWQQYPNLKWQWPNEASTVVMPDVESVLQVQKRTCDTKEEINGIHPKDDVAAVNHSFTITGLVRKLLWMPLLNFQRLRLNLANITLVEVMQGSITPVYYKDQCHREDLDDDEDERA